MGDGFEVAVIGRGMIGSAAARHLVADGISTAVIGPDEPADRTTHQGPFASFHDQGRITRIAARSAVWSELAVRSINRYRHIEQQSGIEFFHPCGLVMGGADAEAWVRRGRAQAADPTLLSDEAAVDALFHQTGIRLPVGVPAMTEGAPAGHINPRRLVEAQTVAAQKAGATVVRDAVANLTRTPSGYTLSGSWGSISAQRILLATGSFGAQFLPAKLDAERRPRTVVMAEVIDGVDTANVPSLIVEDGLDDQRLLGMYSVPPVRYPDGVLRLKIGGQLRDAPVLEPDDLTDWFHSTGSAIEAEALEATLRSLFPNAVFGSVVTAPCVMMVTPSTHPFVGWVDPDDTTFALALAGNGSAAKSSDELGRLGASLIAKGAWDDPVLNEADFVPQWL